MEMRYAFAYRSSGFFQYVLALGVLFLMVGWGLPAQAQDRVVNDGTLDASPEACTTAPDDTSIQAAIDNASSGNTIFVCPGTYAENVVVDKSLTIQGNNAGTPGSGTRADESIIVPEPSAEGPPLLVSVASSNVTIDGFKFDAESDVPVGIEVRSGVEAPVENALIRNNVFENFPSGVAITISETTIDIPFGVGIAGIGSSTGNEFANNLFQNFGEYQPRTEDDPERASIGMAVADGFEASIENNRIDDVAFGVLMTQGRLPEPTGVPILGQESGNRGAQIQPTNAGIAHVSGGQITNVHRGIVFYPGQQDATYEVDGVEISGAEEFGIVSFRFDGEDVNQSDLAMGARTSRLRSAMSPSPKPEVRKTRVTRQALLPMPSRARDRSPRLLRTARSVITRIVASMRAAPMTTRFRYPSPDVSWKAMGMTRIQMPTPTASSRSVVLKSRLRTAL